MSVFWGGTLVGSVERAKPDGWTRANMQYGIIYYVVQASTR
jgi:hypothetical protein